MLHPASDVTAAAATAATSFARALSAEALLESTSRVQVTLHAAGSLEALFAVEHAFASAWSDETPERPVHELIWATAQPSDEEQILKLCAFDSAGRALLERTFSSNESPAATEPARPLAAAPALDRRRHVFLISAGAEVDVLMRVLGAFAVQQAQLADVSLTQQDGQTLIRIEAASLDAERADLLTHKLRALPCVRSVGLGWRQAA